MATNFTIVAGKQWGRLVRVLGGKSLWGTLAAFEVRSQLRVKEDPASLVISNLNQYMSAAYGTGAYANDIEVTWSMTGAQTRTLYAPPNVKGFYDLVLSDTGTTDGLVLPVLSGQIRVLPLMTAASGTT